MLVIWNHFVWSIYFYIGNQVAKSKCQKIWTKFYSPQNKLLILQEWKHMLKAKLVFWRIFFLHGNKNYRNKTISNYSPFEDNQGIDQQIFKWYQFGIIPCQLIQKMDTTQYLRFYSNLILKMNFSCWFQ